MRGAAWVRPKAPTAASNVVTRMIDVKRHLLLISIRGTSYNRESEWQDFISEGARIQRPSTSEGANEGPKEGGHDIISVFLLVVVSASAWPYMYRRVSRALRKSI